MPTVTVPPPYQGPTRGESEISVEGATVRECLEAVGAAYPGFHDQIFDAAGAVHGFVRLFINGELLEREPLATPVKPGDEVGILAAISGG